MKDVKNTILFSTERDTKTGEITVVFFKKKIKAKNARELGMLIDLINALSQELKSLQQQRKGGSE